jgi:hypothetical protein
MTLPPPLPPNPPLPIKIIMWGVTSRKMAFVWLWCCAVLGTISLLCAFITPWALIGAAYFFPFAPWYWAAIRRTDRNNGRWPGFYK